jgi:hypothetical protein
MRKWLLRRSIPLYKRLNLWQLALDSVCLWNSGTWTLGPEARQQLKSMELTQYMKITMHPRRPEERGWDYRQRTARLFRSYLRKRGSGDLVYRAALRVWTFSEHCARLPMDRLVHRLFWCRGCHYRILRQTYTDQELAAVRTVGGRRVRVINLGRVKQGIFKFYDQRIEAFTLSCKSEHWLDLARDRDVWRNLQHDWARRIACLGATRSAESS